MLGPLLIGGRHRVGQQIRAVNLDEKHAHLVINAVEHGVQPPDVRRGRRASEELRHECAGTAGAIRDGLKSLFERQLSLRGGQMAAAICAPGPAVSGGSEAPPHGARADATEAVQCRGARRGRG